MLFGVVLLAAGLYLYGSGVAEAIDGNGQSRDQVRANVISMAILGTPLVLLGVRLVFFYPTGNALHASTFLTKVLILLSAITMIGIGSAIIWSIGTGQSSRSQ